MNTDQVMSVAELNKANIIIGNLFASIADRFGIEPTNIKVDIDAVNADYSLVFIVNIPCNELGKDKFSSIDFDLFCKNNNLNGVIFFNTDYTVTFNMTVKKSNNE